MLNMDLHDDETQDSSRIWLGELKQQAQQRLDEALKVPLDPELWRFSDAGEFDAARYREPLGSGTVDPEEMPSWARELLVLQNGRTPEGSVIQADGRTLSQALSREAREAGVVLASLDEAAHRAPDLVRRHYGQLDPRADRFTVRTLAEPSEGVFLYVPRGVRLREPLLSISQLETGGATLPKRSLVVIDEGASAVLDELFVSAALSRPSLCVPVTELTLGPGAELGWLSVQAQGPQVRHLGRVTARLARDATLKASLITLGAAASRSHLEVRLEGEGARARLTGASVLVGDQQAAQFTVQDHQARRTVSDLLFLGVAGGRARSTYHGTIRVQRGAKGSDAYQKNRQVLLSDGARAEAIPRLEIETDEVRCTHGAAVGPLDPEQVFYLQARGIPREAARRLLLRGFFGPLYEELAWSGLGERLERAVESKLLGEPI